MPTIILKYILKNPRIIGPLQSSSSKLVLFKGQLYFVFINGIHV